MTLELSDYGLELDTYVCYIALSWQFIIPAVIAIVAYKVWKNRKAVK
jgi:hypothetical protein